MNWPKSAKRVGQFPANAPGERPTTRTQSRSSVLCLLLARIHRLAILDGRIPLVRRMEVLAGQERPRQDLLHIAPQRRRTRKLSKWYRTTLRSSTCSPRQCRELDGFSRMHPPPRWCNDAISHGTRHKPSHPRRSSCVTVGKRRRQLYVVMSAGSCNTSAKISCTDWLISWAAHGFPWL